MIDYETRIAGMLEQLGVAADFRSRCTLPLQPEADELVRAEDDMFGRPQYMTRQTEQDWRDMKRAALADGIELLLVSAFRSVDYQCTLIRNKLEKGQHIDDIL
ncbi:MAG TPA: D-alanyl-D-alanine carboxypeptidase family protein, partial [Pseudomonadales bacterium]|nr:D-alanyl-D-alanine carboxypeptidase family protein [Pseudomonadales bacterium]